MKISVVIPTHNRPAKLHECLDCLATQQFDRPFETVVVDDASDDPDVIEQIVEESELDTISLLRFHESRGPAVARNAGAAHADGDVLGFTDDDTLPDKQWLAEIEKAAAEYDLIEGRVRPTEQNTSPYTRIIASETGGEFLTANLAVTRDIFEEVDGFDSRYGEAFREDTDFGFAARDAGASVTFADDAVVAHPVYDRSWWDIVTDTWKFKYDPLLYSRFPEQYRESIVYPFERYTPVYLLALLGVLLSPMFACLLPIVGTLEMRTYGFSGGLWTTSTYALARLFAAVGLVLAVCVGCYRFQVNPIRIFDPREVTRLV